MSPFSKEYTPVIKTDDLKKAPAPKKAPNVFDTGSPQERMQHAAKPIFTESGGGIRLLKNSKMG